MLINLQTNSQTKQKNVCGNFWFVFQHQVMYTKKAYLGHRGKLSFPPKITLALVQRAPTKPPDDEGCPPLSPTKFNSTSTTLTPLHGTDLLHMNWTSSFVIVVPLTFLNSTLLIATFESYKHTQKVYFRKLIKRSFGLRFSRVYILTPPLEP